MSERNLARFIQKETDYKYQSALNLVRKHKDDAYRLKQETGCTFRAAIALLIVKPWKEKHGIPFEQGKANTP